MKRMLNIDIKGMHCASCSRLVEMSLKNKKGIESVSVDLLTNSAAMIIDDIEVKPEEIFEIIENAGFKAFPAEVGENQ